MTVHIYGQYTGEDSSEADALISDARWWSEEGMRVEMVLRFRPARSGVASGYVPWVEAVTARLAAIPGVAAIQIGNEANNTASAAAADGAYPGAVEAIASGVPAARQAVDWLQLVGWHHAMPARPVLLCAAASGRQGARRGDRLGRDRCVSRYMVGALAVGLSQLGARSRQHPE
jgi:hypothetical protein